MTRFELLNLVHGMADICINCRYPDGRHFNKMKSLLKMLNEETWYDVPYGEPYNGSATLVRRHTYLTMWEQMNIWLNAVRLYCYEPKNNGRENYLREELHIRKDATRFSIQYSAYDEDTPNTPDSFVKCTLESRLPYNLRLRWGESKDYHQSFVHEWGWTRFGYFNGHKKGETDPFYLNMEYSEDWYDPSY